jgi:F-type H+-transporting ATPase subunit b
MRRLLFILLLILTPVLYAQTDSTGGSAAHGAETEAHEKAHPTEEPHSGGGGHTEKHYFGIPGWILKIANMVLFIGVLVWLAGGPVKKAFAERTEAIRTASIEARERREKADRMAGDIQARLAAIETEVRAIHERAAAEGERQKRELMAAAEAESQKMLAAARNEVENRLKHARTELTEFAGQLASKRAEEILREKITEQDQKNLFQESLREVGEVPS